MNDETRNEARNRQRLEAKLRGWLQQYKVLFLTLTFSDETLNETTEEQRKRLVKEYLNNESAFYIANKDYGTKNGREHYHAVAVANTLGNKIINATSNAERYQRIKDHINLIPWHKYGQIESQYIAIKYRTKNDRKGNEWKETAHNLAEHFKKESTQGAKLIFSRGIASNQQQLERLYRLDKDLKKRKAERIRKRWEQIGQRYETAEDFLKEEANEIKDLTTAELFDLLEQLK